MPDHPAWERVEPEARELARHHEMIPGEHAIELSKAISLKRLADAIEGIDSEWRLVNAMLAKGA